MKYFRFLLPVLLLVCSTNIAHAQQTVNCSAIDFSLQTYYPGDKSVCSQPLIINYPTYTAWWNYVWDCYQTQTGTVYVSGSVPTIYANGECYTSGGVRNDCAPTVTWTKVIPGSNTGYNQLYLQPENGAFEAVNGNHQCVYNSQTPVLVQCLTKGCTGGGTCGRCGGCTPVVVDTTGGGFSFTSAAGGVKFDMAGDGVPEQMGWTAVGSGVGFLALPDPVTGLVLNGLNLFGNQPPYPNGFEKLAIYDRPDHGGNGDGVISALDSVWSLLGVWTDDNHDGICQIGEMHTLDSLGIKSISLHYKKDHKTDQYGNIFVDRTLVNPNGSSEVGHEAYDVIFVLGTGTNAPVPNLLPNLSAPAGLATPQSGTSCWLLMPWIGGKC